MSIAIFALVVLLLGALRIWSYNASRDSRVKHYERMARRNEPKCYRHCDELREVSALVEDCPQDSPARALVREAAQMLSVRRPDGIYQWRRANEVDDMHADALRYLHKAKELSAAC